MTRIGTPDWQPRERAIAVPASASSAAIDFQHIGLRQTTRTRLEVKRFRLEVKDVVGIPDLTPG
jgi:hypothetical protein